MNNDQHQLISFLAILFAILYLATMAGILAARKQYTEAIGLGGVITGLVGVLGTFRPRTISTNESINEKLVDKLPPNSESKS